MYYLHMGFFYCRCHQTCLVEEFGPNDQMRFVVLQKIIVLNNKIN